MWDIEAVPLPADGYNERQQRRAAMLLDITLGGAPDSDPENLLRARGAIRVV